MHACLKPPPFSEQEPVTEILHVRALGSKYKPATHVRILAAPLRAISSVDVSVNSSPLKPMTHCRGSVIATSSENSILARSSLAFICVTVHTARINF